MAEFTNFIPYVIDWATGTGDVPGYSAGQKAKSLHSLQTDRQFISLDQAFKDALERYPDYFGDQNRFILEEKMKLSAEVLLNYVLETITLQATPDGALFYTLTKEGLTLYIQYYLVDEYDGTDEAELSIFRDEENLINFGGTLTGVLGMINKYISPVNKNLLAYA